MNVIGADVGQARDYTAIAVLQVIELESTHKRIDEADRRGCTWESRNEYHLRALERLDMGTPCRDVIARLRAIGDKISSPDGLHYTLDITAVGNPVLAMARQELQGIVEGLIITAGTEESRDPKKHLAFVPKVDMISALQIAYSSAYLKAAEGLPLLDTLIKE